MVMRGELASNVYVDHSGLRGRKLLLVVGTALGVIGAAVTLVQPLFAGELINDLSSQSLGLRSVLPLLVLFVVDAVMSVGSQLVLARVSEGYVYGLRHSLIARVLHGYWPDVHSYDRGDLYSRIVVDTALSKGWIVGAIPVLLSSMTLVVGCGIAMAVISLPLFFSTFAVLVVFGGVAVWAARGVKRAATENQQDTASFVEGIQRLISSLITIKSSSLEAYAKADATSRAEFARRSGVRVLTRSAILNPVMNVGTQVAIAVTVIVGAALVASGSLSTSSMVAFFMYLLYIVAPLVQSSSAFAEIAQSRAALTRVREVGAIEQEGGLRESDLSIDSRGAAGIALADIEVSHFDSKEPLVSGITGEFSSPGLIALVGPNGVGKSTLLWLLCGLQRPTGGRISINGSDLGKWPVERLRREVVLVQQDASPITGTIRDNLQFGQEVVDDERRNEVLALVGLADFVNRLPVGLDSRLGEGGIELSGGQRRLLALARALLADPRILLLDEFTSNVDREGGAKLLDIAREIAVDRLVIVTSHSSGILSVSDQVVELTPTGLRWHSDGHESAVN